MRSSVRTRLAAPLPSGRILVLLEPAREGRLTAFLARHGEGLAAAYVAGRAVPPARGRAGRPWVVRLARQRPEADDPVIVLVASPSVAAGTIAP